MIEPLQGIDNYTSFIAKLNSLIMDKGFLDHFQILFIADNWEDLPDYIRDIDYEDWAKTANAASPIFKHHDLEVRIPDTGIHVHTDKDVDGVRMHKDTLNPYDSPLETTGHTAEVQYDKARNNINNSVNVWDGFWQWVGDGFGLIPQF